MYSHPIWISFINTFLHGLVSLCLLTHNVNKKGDAAYLLLYVDIIISILFFNMSNERGDV